MVTIRKRFAVAGMYGVAAVFVALLFSFTTALADGDGYFAGVTISATSVPAGTPVSISGDMAGGYENDNCSGGGLGLWWFEIPYKVDRASYSVSPEGVTSAFPYTVIIAGHKGGCSPRLFGNAYLYSFSFPIDTTGFSPGLHTVTLDGTSGGSSFTASVQFTVTAPLVATLSVAPINFNFDTSGLTSGSGIIMNTGTAGSSMNVACVSSAPWLVVDSCPRGPYVAGQSSANQPFTFHVNTADPAVRTTGTYSTHIALSAISNAGTASINGTPQTVGVTYMTSCAANYGQLCTVSNSCGMTNTGTYTCNGNCSASVPSDSLCKSGGPPPSCTFTGSPSVVVPPQQARLSWNCSNVTTCTINDTPITPAANGSIKISPTTNTTYTLSCSGAGGSTSKSVTVIVQSTGLKEINP